MVSLAHSMRVGMAWAPRVLVFLLPLPFEQSFTVHLLRVDPVGTRCVRILFGLKQPLLAEVTPE